MYLSKNGISSKVFLAFAGASAFFLVVLALSIFFVLGQSLLSINHEFGLMHFLTSTTWDPSHDNYGLLLPLCGTVISSLIAIVIATPFGVGVAIFITQFCPPRYRPTLVAIIDFLTAIPSIIIGLWALTTFSAVSDGLIAPLFDFLFSWIPVVGSFFVRDPGVGTNLFTAGLILAIMILPFITSITKEAFDMTPPMLKEAAYSLATTKTEVILDIVIPHAYKGIFGGVILALGRALGETMAITYVIGNSYHFITSIFSPATTITAVIANEFGEASGIHMDALLSLSFILLIINFIVFSLSKLIVSRKR